MNLILVRHGETDWNTERRWQGQLDVPLNGTGEWQARQVGQALTGRPIEYIFSSDLQRARTTATAIAAACDLTVTMDPRLRELRFGVWEGLTYAQLMDSDTEGYNRWKENPATHAPSGGETLDAATRRIVLAWREIEQVDAETVVVVAHGGTLRVLLCHLLQLSSEAFWQLKLDNASLSNINIGPTGNTLVFLNDTQHLQAEGEANEFD